MRTFTVPEETIRSIINYLASRPWVEVNPLIVMLNECEAVDPEIPEEHRLKAVPDDDEVVSGPGNGVT